MGFRNRFARVDIPPGSLLWGVRRRRGFSDLYDPRAHDGLTQHAFIVGNDVRAVCGFRPYRWRGQAVPLTAARDANPQCRKCLNVISMSSSVDQAQDSLTSESAPLVATIEVSEDMATTFRDAAKARRRSRAGRRVRSRPRRTTATPMLAAWPPHASSVASSMPALSDIVDLLPPWPPLVTSVGTAHSSEAPPSKRARPKLRGVSTRQTWTRETTESPTKSI